MPSWLSQFSWDSQPGRVRTTSILVQAFWHFKLKVLKYPRNCSLQNTLIPWNLKNPVSPNIHTYVLQLGQLIIYTTWIRSKLFQISNMKLYNNFWVSHKLGFNEKPLIWKIIKFEFNTVNWNLFYKIKLKNIQCICQ